MELTPRTKVTIPRSFHDGRFAAADGMRQICQPLQLSRLWPCPDAVFWSGLATVSYLPSTAFPTGCGKDSGLPIGLQVNPWTQPIMPACNDHERTQHYCGWRADAYHCSFSHYIQALCQLMTVALYVPQLVGPEGGDFLTISLAGLLENEAGFTATSPPQEPA